MASFTLTSQKFPDGTSVSAYPASNWQAFRLPPSGSPAGSASATASSDGGTVAFTGLGADTRYYAYASVDGEDRYVSFSTFEDVPPAQRSAQSSSGPDKSATLFRGLTNMTNRVGYFAGGSLNGTTQTDQDYRLAHRVAYDGVIERLVFGCFTTASAQETVAAVASAVLQSVAIEYSGTLIELTFGGRKGAVCERDGWLTSDPVYLPVAAGQTLYSKAHVAASSGAGTGTTVSGSNQVTAVAVTSGIIEIGQVITGAGIPAGTMVTECLPTSAGLTLTLSANATASAAGVALTTLGRTPKYLVGNKPGDRSLAGSAAAAPNGVKTVGQADASGSQVFGPMAILGRPKVPKPIIGITGDSVDYGQGNADFDVSFWTQAFDEASLSWVQVATGGDRASYWAAGHGRRRMTLLEGCTHVVMGYGTNDIANGRTAAQVQADMLDRATKLAALGTKVFTRTLTPRAAMSAGQRAEQATLDDWKRDGHPIDPATRAAVATGTAGALRNGASGHPIAAATLETGDAWSTARNSSTFRAGMDSGDGIHPSPAGHAAAQAVVAARIGEFEAA